eukprot:280364-Pyramimonas_sp.AAC.1
MPMRTCTHACASGPIRARRASPGHRMCSAARTPPPVPRESFWAATPHHMIVQLCLGCVLSAMFQTAPNAAA